MTAGSSLVAMCCIRPEQLRQGPQGGTRRARSVPHGGPERACRAVPPHWVIPAPPEPGVEPLRDVINPRKLARLAGKARWQPECTWREPATAGARGKGKFRIRLRRGEPALRREGGFVRYQKNLMVETLESRRVDPGTDEAGESGSAGSYASR